MKPNVNLPVNEIDLKNALRDQMQKLGPNSFNAENNALRPQWSHQHLTEKSYQYE